MVLTRHGLNCLSNVKSHPIAPVIIHHAVADAPLVLLFGGLVLLLFDDHLPLGKIAYDTKARFKGWYWRTGDGLQEPCMMHCNYWAAEVKHDWDS